jgi:hypothetical protein
MIMLWLNKTTMIDETPVTTPHVVVDMLSQGAVNDGAKRLHPLLKGVEVNTGQTEDYPFVCPLSNQSALMGN